MCIRATIGDLNVADREYCLGRGVAGIRPGKSADHRYVWYALSTTSSALLERARGATFLQVTKKDVVDHEIPLPPLAEQRRIADILDRADAVRRKREESLKLVDDLLQSVFLDMFGDPVTNPKGWPVERLGKSIQTLTAGWSVNGDEHPPGENDWGVLKVSAVSRRTYRPEESKVVSSGALANMTGRVVVPRRGDLLVSRANTAALVGASCIVERAPENVFLSDKLWRVALDDSRLLPEFLHVLIGTPSVHHEIEKRATGTSGSMLNISQRSFAEVPVLHPPVHIQRRFVEVYRRSRGLAHSAMNHQSTLDQLTASLTQRAFRGEL